MSVHLLAVCVMSESVRARIQGVRRTQLRRHKLELIDSFM